MVMMAVVTLSGFMYSAGKSAPVIVLQVAE